jgi:hypothetical protein
VLRKEKNSQKGCFKGIYGKGHNETHFKNCKKGFFKGMEE